MRRVGLIAVVLLFSLLAAAPAAHAQKRVALVIGNSAYQHTPKLANPKNDATDMVAALKKLGVQVTEGFDLDKAAFDRKVRDFAAALQGTEAGLFFFAGHGLQVAGHNYLVPVDAELKTASALDFEMVRVDVVQRVMEHETSTNVLFLDACRDNPLARNLARALGTRSAEIGRGFAPVVSGVGTLISFSTQPGNVALDGTGRNSPFAGALMKHLVAPKDDLSAILIDVRNDVMRETQNKQVPWEHSALRGRFYFSGPAQVATAPSVQLLSSEAAEAWGVAERTKSVAAFEAFIRRFGDTYYGDLAKVRLAELKQAEQEAEAAKKKADEEARAKAEAERKRLALLQQQQEERKRAEAAEGKKVGQVFRDCPDCPEMVVMPAGSFMMGSPASEEGRSENEGPQHTVTIAQPFAVGKFEVTFAEWDACVGAGGCKHKTSDADWGRGKRPVINVSWNDITTEYLPWLSRKTGKTYRLLSEAEWEYAARAGTSTPFSTGRTITPEQANFDGNYTYAGSAKGVYRRRTVEVGTYQPNSFGLYDMHGNVWEWLQDCWNGSYQSAPTDGSAWTTGDCGSRVLRGGSWGSLPLYLRSAIRVWFDPNFRNYGFGFRVGRTLSP